MYVKWLTTRGMLGCDVGSNTFFVFSRFKRTPEGIEKGISEAKFHGPYIVTHEA